MKTLAFFLLCILSCSVLLLSCTKENRTVPVRLMLTDNPVAYDSVNVRIKGIKVKINKDDAGWIDLQAKDTLINLLDLQNGTTTLLAQGEVPEGTLKEVRFILGEDHYVVVNGQAHPLQTPSAEDAGLKIKIDKHLEETLNTFVLDFDAALSIKEQDGSYKLMPVIKLKE